MKTYEEGVKDGRRKACLSMLMGVSDLKVSLKKAGRGRMMNGDVRFSQLCDATIDALKKLTDILSSEFENLMEEE